MKKYMKKIVAWLLLVILVIGVSPASAFAEEDPQIRALGGRYLEPAGDYTVKSDDQPTRKVLPYTYNSASNGYCTPVRNQSPHSTCWTHSTMIFCSWTLKWERWTALRWQSSSAGITIRFRSFSSRATPITFRRAMRLRHSTT